MKTLHIQIALQATPERIFEALTTAEHLEKWFAEKVDIALSENRYDFWGRFTPGTPTEENGKHPLLSYEVNKSLKFQWHYDSVETTVSFIIEQRGTTTYLLLTHDVMLNSHDIRQIYFADFWFLSLENLRRYLDGREIVARCDFSAIKPGNFSHMIDIDAPPEDVFGALIRPDQLNRWIASNATVEPVVGGKYDYGWKTGGPVKILEIKPNEKLTIAWPDTDPDSQQPIDTVVAWTLEGSGGKTRLTIVHSGFAPNTRTDGLQAGWLNFINWIKSMLEYGSVWQPPYVRLSIGSESYYAASIVAGQVDLITREI